MDDIHEQIPQHFGPVWTRTAAVRRSFKERVNETSRAVRLRAVVQNQLQERRTRLWHVQALDGLTHFLTRRLPNVGTEMSLNVLAYNLMRVLRILGFKKTMKAMRLAGV